MAKITYPEKSIGDQFTAADANEIKTVVNENVDLAPTFFVNVVYINDASDFPDAVGGVRELVPNPGDRILYLVAATIIDMGNDSFSITDGEIVIRGVHRTASGLTSTTSGNFFTCIDSGFFPEFLSFICPNARVVDFTASIAFKSFTCQNIIVISCDSIFRIAGAFTTSLRITTIVASQNEGILWTGTANSQINISDLLAIAWTGKLIDLGTATFDLISIGSGCRFLSPAGTVILSGMVDSGNIKANGFALVDNNIFNGSGIALENLKTDDLRWDYDGNIFGDGTTNNTFSSTDGFLTASQTTTINDIGVYVPIGGTFWDTSLESRFTVNADGLATYNGLQRMFFKVVASSTVDRVGGGSDLICTKIAYNGTVSDKTIGCTDNGSPTQVNSMGFFDLSTGDTIQTFVGNEDSTANIITANSTLIITEL